MLFLFCLFLKSYSVIIYSIMEKEKLLETRNIIDAIYKNGINKNYIKELYRILGNDAIPLIFLENISYSAAFDFEKMCVYVDNQKINKWSGELVSNILKYSYVCDAKLLKSYLISYILCHEIEHSNQKLIAEAIKKPTYDYEKNVYFDMYNVVLMREYSLFKPFSLIKNANRYKIYRNNDSFFILERNAVVEGLNIVSSVANICNDKEMLDILINLININMLKCYEDSKEGCLKYTYRRLGMMKKYNSLVFPNDISLDEKVRRGLELTEEQRDKVVLSLGPTIYFK